MPLVVLPEFLALPSITYKAKLFACFPLCHTKLVKIMGQNAISYALYVVIAWAIYRSVRTA